MFMSSLPDAIITKCKSEEIADTINEDADEQLHLDIVHVRIYHSNLIWIWVYEHINNISNENLQTQLINGKHWRQKILHK